MLGALRKVFIHDTEKADTAASDQGNPNFITDPQKISRLLQQIIESPPLCTVSIRNFNKTFFTSILEIQKEKGLVIFDELTPVSGNNLLSQCDVVRLSTFINGVHLTFDLKQITRDQAFNQIVYKALLPETIYYPQRRSSPRIQTDPATIDFQGISRDTGMLIKGYVLDISRTGLCVAFSKNGSNILSGDKLSSCLIQLPGESTFSFDLSVRSIRKVSPSSLQKQIGGFFNGLSPQNQNKLDRSICALERLQIRKRKN
jgi:c-di-GMP-binding flagellar brake protein YcgR